MSRWTLATLATICFSGALRADVHISELLADNETGIQDEDGSREDWLELCNTGDAAVNLDGWWLTDTVSNPTQWRIPNVSIPAKGFLFIWASGKDRRQPGAPLHTSFSLSKSGEYLGIYRPNPTNGQPALVDHFLPGFPSLPPDISYGRSFVQPITNFVKSGDVGRNW